MDYGPIESIRILPSDKLTFETEWEFRTFIRKTMPKRGGFYYFPNQMMNCPVNTFVLFQYDGMIRATGILIDREKTSVVDERGVKYGGYYHFEVSTLHYLAHPIDKDSFKQVCPVFTGFTQTKQIIPLQYWDTIYSLLANIDSYYSNEYRRVVTTIESEKLTSKDRDDKQKNADAKYNALRKVKTKIPAVKHVRHKKFGEGVVLETKGELSS